MHRQVKAMKRYIRTSTTIEYDSEGNEVPAELAEKLRESKIRNRKGQLIVCYHGTNAEFNEFKDEFISSNSGNIGWFGKGFYFTDSIKLAKSYGNIQRRCYLNITHPFIYSSEDSLWELLSLGVENIRSYNGRLMPYAYLDDPAPVEDFTKAIRQAGYDGVKFSYRQAQYKPNIAGVSKASEYVCFNSSQVYFID